MLKLKLFTPQGFAANCYILKDEKSGDALVVDPGAYNNRLEAMLRQEGITELRYILLTHGHFDHIIGVSDLQKSFGGKVVIHKADESCLWNGMESLASYFGEIQHEDKADVLVGEGDELSFGDEKIRVMHTPGHTKGCVCYIIRDMLFSGDTLFKGSIGRTDFPSSDEGEMLSSLRRLVKLEGDYRVLPGHEQETTLSQERKFNPLLKGL